MNEFGRKLDQCFKRRRSGTSETSDLSQEVEASCLLTCWGAKAAAEATREAARASFMVTVFVRSCGLALSFAFVAQKKICFKDRERAGLQGET